MPKLIEFGERQILATIIPAFVDGAGDDCAILEAGGSSIIVTTDPVPPPAAMLLGGDPDPYWMGWLLVTINASDLAAAGAAPLGFVAAIECPSETEVQDFERFLRGVRDSCAAQGLRYCGGNLREALKLSAVGTAIGWTQSWSPLKRTGAEVGDLLLSIGYAGRFWRDVFLIRAGNRPDPTLSPLFAPKSQLGPMQGLARKGWIKASMDNSDGLLPTLTELARQNSLSIVLDLDQVAMHEGDSDDQSLRNWLGWGDWNVLVAATSENLDAIQSICREAGSVALPIGTFASGTPDVLLTRGGNTIQAARLESERFARDSWFSEGIDGYVRRLCAVPLP